MMYNKQYEQELERLESELMYQRVTSKTTIERSEMARDGLISFLDQFFDDQGRVKWWRVLLALGRLLARLWIYKKYSRLP